MNQLLVEEMAEKILEIVDFALVNNIDYSVTKIMVEGKIQEYLNSAKSDSSD